MNNEEARKVMLELLQDYRLSMHELAVSGV